MNNQLMLQIAIQYPLVFGLAKVRLNSSVKAKKNKALRKMIEFAVIAFTGLINPKQQIGLSLPSNCVSWY